MIKSHKCGFDGAIIEFIYFDKSRAYDEEGKLHCPMCGKELEEVEEDA